MIGMVRTGCSRWWATRGSSAFAAAPAGALFLAGDCAMKAVIATAQQMAATTTANRVSRWMLNGSRSSVIAWELGQLEWEVSVPMAGSLFLSGTCHIGSDGWDILRARLWQFCVTSAARPIAALSPAPTVGARNSSRKGKLALNYFELSLKKRPSVKAHLSLALAHVLKFSHFAQACRKPALAVSSSRSATSADRQYYLSYFGVLAVDDGTGPEQRSLLTAVANTV